MIDRGAEQPSAWQTTQRYLARLRLVNQFVHDLSSRGILFPLCHRVSGMAVPEESFVISFGHVLVSSHSMSFSHTFSDGLTLLSGMRGSDAFRNNFHSLFALSAKDSISNVSG